MDATREATGKATTQLCITMSVLGANVMIFKIFSTQKIDDFN
jgi:hypothetical protein